MPNSADWHQRFLQQAAWTLNLRQHLYSAAALEHANRVLEVGCGTGAILTDLPAYTPAAVHGLDFNFAHLRLAQSNSAENLLTAADAQVLPFPNASFDVCLCHFFLLWVHQPEYVLREMARVTRRGGFVLALAEPDYGGRLDYPLALADIGYAQSEALRKQGADPLVGRRLPALLNQAGLRLLRAGIMGAEWHPEPDPTQREIEWRVLTNDLKGRFAPDELTRLRAQDEAAALRGERILFVPTFFALAQVE